MSLPLIKATYFRTQNGTIWQCMHIPLTVHVIWCCFAVVVTTFQTGISRIQGRCSLLGPKLHSFIPVAVGNDIRVLLFVIRSFGFYYLMAFTVDIDFHSNSWLPNCFGNCLYAYSSTRGRVDQIVSGIDGFSIDNDKTFCKSDLCPLRERFVKIANWPITNWLESCL